MHDIADLQLRGIPGVLVATVEFEDAAVAQGKALGIDPRRVLVPHPIQDRTDEELRAMADAAVDDVVAALLVQP